MTTSRSTSPAKLLLRLAAAAALLGSAAEAAAQAEDQFLLIEFAGVATSVPLSAWLTASIALVLAAAAFATLRRGRPGGGRVFGWVIVALAGGALLAATGQRIVSEARAGFDPPVIDLSVSPGSLGLQQYSVSLAEVEVTVTNTTGQSVVITQIALTPPSTFYVIDLKGSTCLEGLELSPGQSCTVLLLGQDT